MATKRKTLTLRGGDIIDVVEFHDGNYGAPSQPRIKRQKPTKEQMEKVNRLNKARRCRQKMLAYIDYDDYFGTWTYKKSARPPNMVAALLHFQKAKRKVQAYFKKQGYELFWFRNIERGTKGAWHIHFVMNKIQGAAEVITKSWEHGGTYIVPIKESEFYDEDFTKLANYMTKDESTIEYNQDGTIAKPRLKEANYNTSRNMPLPEPKVDKLVRWKSEVKPKKGYYMASIYEGINPATGYMYRRYTMIRIRGDDG
ncbi:MAG: hypothetical protein IJA54_08070 [Tyzzerella sp.]|nr:hypothetical protein [Tyzzerella sp.]